MLLGGYTMDTNWLNSELMSESLRSRALASHDKLEPVLKQLRGDFGDPLFMEPSMRQLFLQHQADELNLSIEELLHLYSLWIPGGAK